MHVQCDTDARSCNHCRSGKELSVKCSECVSVAFGIQHEMRMLRIIMSSSACPALQNLSTLSHKRHDFRYKVIEHKNKRVIIYFEILDNFCNKIFLFLRLTERYIKNEYRSSCTAPVILVRFR